MADLGTTQNSPHDAARSAGAAMLNAAVSLGPKAYEDQGFSMQAPVRVRGSYRGRDQVAEQPGPMTPEYRRAADIMRNASNDAIPGMTIDSPETSTVSARTRNRVRENRAGSEAGDQTSAFMARFGKKGLMLGANPESDATKKTLGMIRGASDEDLLAVAVRTTMAIEGINQKELVRKVDFAMDRSTPQSRAEAAPLLGIGKDEKLNRSEWSERMIGALKDVPVDGKGGNARNVSSLVSRMTGVSEDEVPGLPKLRYYKGKVVEGTGLDRERDSLLRGGQELVNEIVKRSTSTGRDIVFSEEKASVAGERDRLSKPVHAEVNHAVSTGRDMNKTAADIVDSRMRQGADASPVRDEREKKAQDELVRGRSRQNSRGRSFGMDG